jgi:hypothetical protein
MSIPVVCVRWLLAGTCAKAWRHNFQQHRTSAPLSSYQLHIAVDHMC